MNIQYRKLQSGESKLYRNIRLESLQKFPESFGVSYEEATKNEKLRIEFDIENQTKERFVVGAFHEKQLIGICTFIKDENDKGNIYQMYVQSAFQGNNIGACLIKKTIEETNKNFGVIDIFLEVKVTNLKAYHLYKKIGFIEINENAESENNSVILMKYSPTHQP
ncbi:MULTISPECIES: GNAT family N-acetyltransferase [unclassified Chryseobacterium]|uniref:GNAT family N-acetyltransferase n=1 Tax=unclassified Chryseobacterium TaxID=2593645 RepID=UPI002269B5EC|nr:MULTISPECIES: GNAT family N-acetyltransferase [unclassified Chryseobacterium]